MTTEELKDQIIVKYNELTKIYEDYVIANEIEGYKWESDFKNPANKVLSELEILKQQLLQAELEPTKPCNNCKYSDLAYDEYPCFMCYDGLNKSFGKWDPVKVPEEMEEEKHCCDCEYGLLDYSRHPCCICSKNLDMWKPKK